ncbi:PQQ-dependent sugar dehydrogenase [Myceligenerans sp. I2]|uniref:PQQ-dependent sugar dehydrogenase n=1 Tax=Myceligenerans indicum TaxID=2593663 RepID=A0ABS1LG77_9MICO|nr:PQQ-dependent sugar dehydrogenase [Myceligenerans indicum]
MWSAAVSLRHRRRTIWLVCAAVVSVLAAGCGSNGSTPSPSSGEDTRTGQAAVRPPFGGQVRTIATGLEVPWSVVFVDGSALVSERDSGRILEVGGDGTLHDAGVVPGVVPGGEGGLLGLAARDHDLYVYSTGTAGNRVERYPVEGSAGSLSLGSPTPVLDGLPAGTYHDGGRIAFGPDGMLYVAVGDTQDAGTAQELDALSGKILRVTPDGGIPADNPFPGSPVYSYGHRNVQGLAWTDDGTMFATEFGDHTWDELNLIEAGNNYGWPQVEGAGGTGGLVDPVQQWSPAEASPSGLAAVGDTLFVANLRGQVLRTVPAADPATSTEHFAGRYGRLRDVAAAPDGSLWFVTSNTDGRGVPDAEDDRILSVDLVP